MKFQQYLPFHQRRRGRGSLFLVFIVVMLLLLVLTTAVSWVSFFLKYKYKYKYKELDFPQMSNITTTNTSMKNWSIPIPIPLPQQQSLHSGGRTFNSNSTSSNYNNKSSSSSLVVVGAGADGGGPYHDWELFATDFAKMMRNLKIFVYPTPDDDHLFDTIFLPHPNPFDPKLGNYHSEHMFKVSLLRSSLITPHPGQAHLFFLPFSINALRNHPRVHSESSISQFVSQYTSNISRHFRFWNASSGSDHFFVCCHSVGRDAVSLHPDLHNNALQVTCSSSYFQKFYISRKDFAFPQVWPRPREPVLNPPHNRDKLVFFAGRMQNSIVRQQLIALWGNDTSLDIFSTTPSYPYEEGFRKSKYCLHLKGYEVNTARVSDAIHYGCIPVIISNYYDLPFANVLDWSKFSVIINQGDISHLKKILLSISRDMYLSMYSNLCQVRKHFVWHTTPRGYDSFHMTAYQLWLRRSTHHHVSSHTCN